VPFLKYFIADPKDQNPGKKNCQIETDKPGERDGNHGLEVF
jgi:hypothetical protein